jgi:Zn-dependent protease with chaperone function
VGWLLAVPLMLVAAAAASSLLLCLPVMVAAESLVEASPRVARWFWMVAAALPALCGLAVTTAALLTLTGDIAASPHQDRIRPHLCLQAVTRLPDAPFRFELYAALALGLLLFAAARGALALMASARTLRAARQLLPAAGGEGVVELPGEQPLCFSLGVTQPVTVCTTGLRKLLSAEEHAAVLAHERGHARRRDPLVELLLRLVTDALVWVPTTHYYLRQARAARELDCDAEAAAATSTAALVGALRKMGEAGQARHRQRAGDLSRLRPTFPDYAEPDARVRALTQAPEASLAPSLRTILVIEAVLLGVALVWLRHPLHDTVYCLADSLLAVLRT